MNLYDITVRDAQRADGDALGVPADGLDGHAAVDLNGKLIAVMNEYGTADTAPEWTEAKESIEALGEAAADILAHLSSVTQPDYSQDRGWFVMVHDVDSDIVYDVFNHEPTQEDIHFIVIDFWARCGTDILDIPRKSTIYFDAGDMPDHTGISVGRIGEPEPEWKSLQENHDV